MRTVKGVNTFGKIPLAYRTQPEFGIKQADAEFDFAEVMERVQQVIKQIEPHDSIERYSGLGVDVVIGEARITSPWTVEVNGDTIRTRNIVVATGGQPFVPPIEGIDQVDYYTSDNLWDLREQAVQARGARRWSDRSQS